ncbi:MAG: aminotransferase class V-fold PLP-dependent enzyme, partial [Acutalibacteraceae bacterium]
PCILHISAGHVRAQTMLNYLSQRGIFVSSGSACAKGARSHVLVAMGLPQKEIDSSLRISFSYQNTPDDIHALCAALQSGLRDLIARP